MTVGSGANVWRRHRLLRAIGERVSTQHRIAYTGREHACSIVNATCGNFIERRISTLIKNGHQTPIALRVVLSVCTY